MKTLKWERVHDQKVRLGPASLVVVTSDQPRKNYLEIWVGHRKAAEIQIGKTGAIVVRHKNKTLLNWPR